MESIVLGLCLQTDFSDVVFDLTVLRIQGLIWHWFNKYVHAKPT
jgi:hypothetical protein